VTGPLGLPLVFAAHLLSLLVAASAALVLFREPGRGRLARSVGALGFLVLAAGEAYHGAEFSAEGGTGGLWLRSAGYLLVLLASLTRARVALPSAALQSPALLPVAAVGVPGGRLTPAAIAAAAGLVTAVRRRSERGGLWLALGLLLLAASEATVAVAASWGEAVTHGLRVAGYLSAGVFVFGLTRHSIRFRMAGGFVALLLAVTLAVSSAVAQVISENLRGAAVQRVSDQVVDADAALDPRAQDAARLVVIYAGALGGDFNRRAPTAAAALLELSTEFDFVILLNRKLQILDRAGVKPREAIGIAGTDVVASAKRRTASRLVRFGDEQRLVLIGASPVRHRPGGRAVGVAVAGIRVDRSLLERLVPPGSPAAVLGGGSTPLATTFPGTSDEGPEPFLPEPVLQDIRERTLFSQGPVLVRVSVGGTDYFGGALALRREGESLGMLIVGEPAEVLTATQRGVTRVLFLVALGAAGLALLLALVAARRITQPVLALTDAARRVRSGELEATAEVRGEDEVADLAVAFNRMTSSVNTMTGELRDAAEEQARLRARLETVVNSMGDGLVAVSDDDRVVTYNPAAAQIIGLPRSRVVGKPIKDVLKGRDASGRQLFARRAVPTGTVFVRRPDGRDVPVAISSSNLRDGTGVAIGRVFVLRDMSREHQVERMKTEFLSNVSHELRTPLTPIIGYSEILSRRDVTEGRAREFGEGILESARRLERIVAMLVDFSAIEGGRLAVATETTSIRPLVASAVEGWKSRSRKHRFVTRFQAGLPSAEMDVSLSRRILDELLDNAVKYSPQGGRVNVSVGIDESRQAASGKARKRRMLRVDVSDQGIGVEPEDLARIFQDFRQVDASDTRAFGGLGLGLAFVKRMVEAQGGTITARSEPGEGSTFSFTVPAADGVVRGDGRSPDRGAARAPGRSGKR
jgi:PAS domain S-box-containing protein